MVALMTKSGSVSQTAAAGPDFAETGTVQDRLLDAALVCFRRMGGRRTRIEDIAAEAGLARTAVYRYYPNKRAIVAALATRWLAEDETRLAEIARDHGRSPATRLQAFLLADADATRRYLTDACLVEVLDEVIENLKAILLQHRSHVRRHLAGLLAEGSAAGVFRADPADAMAQTIDDLMARFHDLRLATELDKTTWRDRAGAAIENLMRAIRSR